MWALGDARGRGFLLGCTAGRTTLNGEGLQHQDGHSLLLASTVPSVAAYDPAFSYEVAAIVEDGIRRMTGPEPEDRIWYLTLYNENYPMPALPADPAEAERVRLGTIKGMYRFAAADRGGLGPGLDGLPRSGTARATLLFSGSAWQAAMEARRMLAVRVGRGRRRLVGDVVQVAARGRDLASNGGTASIPTRPSAPRSSPRASLESAGPIVAVTDFMRSVPDQVSRWMPRRFTSLGTDGFGRSDTREVLRRFFEVDAAHVVVAVLHGLAARRRAARRGGGRGHRALRDRP